MEKVKKEALKTIFDSSHTKFFNVKFMIAWMQNTYNFE